MSSFIRMCTIFLIYVKEHSYKVLKEEERENRKPTED